jgi:hypothetical protein
MKPIQSDYERFEDKKIEDILCLSTLITGGVLGTSSDTEDTDKYFQKLEWGCADCPLVRNCLACIINQ